MSNQVVLITGALTGIGRATALAFARDGADIVVSGRRPEAGAALAAELRDLGVQAEFIQADVRHEADVAALVDKTVARFGRIDVAVNNAGTEGTPLPITAETAETYAATFDTNVLGTILSLKHEIRAMLPNRKGSIINLSSVFGHSGAPNASIYAASKHAVEGLTASVAQEVGKSGIRVNAVAPGPIQTEMFNRFTGNSQDTKDYLASTLALGRIGRVEDIAEAILFIASDKAAYITGHSIPVDGGHA